MKVHRGDVVLVNYPFASGTGSKVRPALVVQSDQNNVRLDNTIIALITSRTHLARTEPTQLLVEQSSSLGKLSGLHMDSALSCENLFTIRKDMIIRSIGNFPDDAMHRVDACLKAALQIA